jgi:hypothetical protein
MRDPWSVLGLAPGSSWDEVRAAYRRLAKSLHPDVSGGDTTRMAEINRAVDELASSRAPVPAATTAPPAKTLLEEGGFSIDVLPVEAFDLVYMAAASLGDPWVIDEPYQLVARLDPPLACRCHVDLVPEAGGSIVTLRIEPLRGIDPPDSGAVVSALVAELQRL